MKIKVLILILVLIGLNYYFYKKSNKERNSNIELLRIISMVLIVAHHFALHGYGVNELKFSENKLILDFLSLGGKIGVNIFIIISSYYLIDKKYNVKSLLKSIYSVKIYAVLFLIVGIILKVNIEIVDIIKSVFPVIYSLYWFITGYIILYMIYPFLNIFLKGLSKEKIKLLIGICIVLYSCINVFLGATLFFSSIIWFVILYIFTYYLKMYIDLNKINHKKIIVISILMYFVLYLVVVIFDILGSKYSIFRIHMLYFARENSIFSIIIAFGLFLYFVKRSKYSSKIINYISSGTLGVYLIHENVFVRPLLYGIFIDNRELTNINFSVFFCRAVCSVILIFISCLIIGLIIDYIISILFQYINFNFIEKKLLLYKQFLIRFGNKYEK